MCMLSRQQRKAITCMRAAAEVYQHVGNLTEGDTQDLLGFTVALPERLPSERYWDLLTLLKMRFQEPQLLVEGARERDEKIVGIGVARLGGRVDRRAHQASELGIALDQGRKVVRRRIDVGRIGSEGRRPRDH